MTIPNRLSAVAAVAFVVCLALPLGCEGKSEKLSGAPQTQPAAPHDEPPVALPPEALTKLDDLQPKLARPVNPKTVEKLPPRARRDVEEAAKKLAEEKYAAAIDLLEGAVGFDPANAKVQRMLGKAYLALPNRGKALSHLAAAAKAAPDDLETHLLLGRLAAAQEQNANAILQLRTALKCSQARPADPRAGEALLTLSLLLERAGYWTAASEGYTLLSEWTEKHARDYAARPALREWSLHPERLLARRGALLLLLRKPAEAAGLLKRAYRRNRTNARVAKLLIDALLAEKQYAEAEKLLLEMAGEPEQRPNVSRMLATLCRQAREKALPQRFWGRFQAKYKTDPTIAVALARAASDLGWDDSALAILRSILSASPTDKDLWRILCRNYARRDQFEGLFAIIQETVSADPNAVEAIAEGLSGSAASVKTPGVERKFAEKARKATTAQPLLLYLAGRVATARRKHLLAADLYRRATEQDKRFYIAFEALLEAYVAQKRQDQVDRLLERIGRLARDTHLPAYFRGKIALGRGDAAAAIEALNEALKRNAGNRTTELLLARAYVAAGRTGNAIATLKEVFGRDADDTDVARRLFDLYLSQRRIRDARLLATQVLRHDRESTTGRLMVAELALRTGQRTRAMTLLGELSRQAPDNADVQLLSVRALLGPRPGVVSKRQFDAAAANLSRILRSQPASRPARRAMAQLLAAVDKTAEAAGIWATVFDEAPDDAEVVREYVGALIRAKQHKTALRAVQRFRKGKPDDLWGRVQELDLLGRVKRFDEIRNLGDQWVKDANDPSIALILRQEMLRIFQTSEEFPCALKVVDDWLAKGPSKIRRRQLDHTRVHVLSRLGRHDEAKKLAERLTQSDASARAARILVATLIEAKQPDRALKLLDEWIPTSRRRVEDMVAVTKAVGGLSKKKATTDPQYAAAVKKIPEAVRQSVTQAVEAKQYDQALAVIDGRMELLAQSVDDLRALRIVVCGESKQLGRARRLAEEWVKASPQALSPRRALVGLLAEANADDKADKLVTRWLKDLTATTVPTQPAGLTEVVQWLRETSVRLKLTRQKHAEALKAAEENCKLDPNNTEFLALKSACLTELGRDEEALAVMEAALVLKPNDAGLNNNLGYMYAERGIHLDKAQKLLEKALADARETRSRIAYEDSRAWILYKRGMLREAGRAFQRILGTYDDEEIAHGVILDHAGDVYCRLGWRQRAVHFWKRALVLAKKVKRPTREEKALLAAVAAKLEAVRNAREPKLAPLGASTPKASKKGRDGTSPPERRR